MLMLCLVLFAASTVLVAAADNGSANKERMVKSHEAMVAKFSELFESKENYRAVGVEDTMVATVPYSTTGYLYRNVYFGDGSSADSGCSSISSVEGFPVNTCMVGYNVAFKYQLTQDSCSGGIVQYFGDEKCTLMLGTSPLEPYMNNCDVDINYQYKNLTYASWQCSTSASPIAPVGSILTLTYLTNYCGGSLVGYIADPVDVCVPSTLVTWSKFSCDGAEPKVETWPNAGCSGAVSTSTELDSDCVSSSDDGYYYYYDDNNEKTGAFVDKIAKSPHAKVFGKGHGNTAEKESANMVIEEREDDYLPPFMNIPPSASQTDFPTSGRPTWSSQVFCPEVAPTLKPAFAPTVFPTSAAATVVSLTLAQKVFGINAATFTSNAAYATAFATTVASTMTGITAADIINIKVSDTRASRRLTGRSLSMENAAISVTYTVSATTTSSSDALYYELDSAVSSGAFNTALTSYATVYGADSLQGCTSSSVGPPSSSSSKGLSAGAIAGIVIGTLAGVAIIAGLIYYFTMPTRTPMAQAMQYDTTIPLKL